MEPARDIPMIRQNMQTLLSYILLIIIIQILIIVVIAIAAMARAVAMFILDTPRIAAFHVEIA